MRALGAILAAAALVGAAPAYALDTPKSGPSDPRIKIVDYDPWAVVKVTGVFRTATQILLGPDETILHVAVGDATGWDVAAEKNILFVKPKAALYMFPKLDPKIYPIKDDQQFAYDLLSEQKVLIVQGTGFNWIAPDHFRIVFLPNSDDLTEAIGRIARFLEHYRKRHAL